MDVNGFKGPNSEARNGKQYDIRSFKVARFSKGCAGVEVPNVGCVYQLPSFSPIKAGSEEMKKWDPGWKQEGKWWSGYDNYWAGAKKACDDIGMSLPDKSKLKSLAKKTTAEKEQLGLPTSGWFWSSSESDVVTACGVDFYWVSTGMDCDNKHRSGHKVLCVGD